MRRWLICTVLTIAVALGSTPVGAEECQVIYVNRPDGHPPIGIEVCPPGD